jgi:hypothetical protein
VPADIPLPRHYGRRSLATLTSLIERLCPPPEVFAVPRENVLATTLGFVPFLAVPLRYGLPLALWLFDAAPVLLGFGPRRFAKLPAADADRYLRHWEHGRPPLSQVYAAFHSLILCSFYQQPEVLAALEIDWQGRARELIERRARLLAEAQAPSEDVASSASRSSG